MAFEMICGQCRGNLLVEQFGVVVACPHCGAHLSIPAPPGATPPQPNPAPVPVPIPVSPPAPAPTPIPASITPNAPAPVLTAPASPPVVEEPAATTVAEEQVPFFEAPASEPVATSDSNTPASGTAETAPVVPVELFGAAPDSTASNNDAVYEAPATIEEPSVTASEPSGPDSSHPLDALFGASEETPNLTDEPLASDQLEAPATPAPDHSAPAPQTEISSITDAIPTSDPVGDPFGVESANVEAADIVASNSEEPVASDNADVAPMTVESAGSETTQNTDGQSKPPTPAVDSDHVLLAKTSVLLLLSYTSAVTIGFLYLFFHLMNHKDADYGLESLPDVAPLKKGVSILLVPERAEMPDGHDLKIGESQTFGNIKVTVSKVTRGPIQFVHHSRKADEVRLPSSPVLKLWLKFENVSKDQEIPPLDSQLLFSRRGKTRFEWRANQFVCREEDKANTDKRKVYIYDHNFQSPWDLANLPLEKPLKPKESREYYVPSGENDLELLDGSLLWRVHFRKGYGPKGRGVTTIFEVHFDAKEIKDEQV